ncbi:MAG: efflux RND transporter permease subunit [Acidobacteriota bacterium]
MNAAAHSVRNRALVNALVIVIIVVGAHSLITMPRELNSRVGFNWVFLLTFYPGASPEEVERLITIPIEDELTQVKDVDVVLSQSEPGKSFVLVKFEQISESDFERRLEDVRAQVARVDLPEEVENTEVREFDSYDFQPVVSVAISGDVPERTLHDVAHDLEEELKDIRGLGRVEAFGERRRAILVECDPRKLEAHGLDIVDVEDALRLADRNLPAGVLKLGERELLLRTRAEISGAEDVASVTLRAGGGGSRLKVGDVAEVTDGFEDQELVSRFDGKPAVAISLTKNERGNTLDIVADTRALVDSWGPRLPPGVELDLYNDESLVVRSILSVLQSNAVLGLMLVILGLVLFVGWRAALCAALGIPVTFLLALVALDWTGDSLNGSTLFGLILVLGMVVDDAIVILENCYRHLQEGKSLQDAAIDGVQEVAAPVVISTLTTLAGFLPLVLMPGTMGKFMRIIPITVALVLLASLFEAFWILPSHFVEFVRLKRQHRRGDSRMRRLQGAYSRALRALLNRRYVAAVVCCFALVGSVWLIPQVGVELFAGDAISTVGIMVTMPTGTRIEQTERVLSEFEQVALELPEQELEGVMANVGLQQQADDWVNGAHLGQVWIDLVESGDRDRDIDQIVDDLRRRTAGILGPSKLQFQVLDGGPPADDPVELMVKGPDLTQIEEVADLLQAELASLPGVFDVRDDADDRQPKVDVLVDREAAARRGLDASRIARSVRAAFGGAPAATWRDGDEELDVLVRLPETYRQRLEDLSSLRFVSPAGDAIPFSAVATLAEGTSPQTLRRHDRQQAVTVSADVDENANDIRAVNLHIRDHFERIRAAYPSVRIEEGGQFREFTEAFNSLVALFGLGLLLIFMLLSGQFKNWSQPFVILAVVPLSFIGAMLGLLVAGSAFSISTLYGFVALAGVAVNDSIVLVAFVNQLRQQGLDRWESLAEAGRLRLRPILLTSVTTILGLLPMAIGLGGSSKTWQPLATTIAAGLAVATVICLFVIPCLQAIVDDFGDRLRRFTRRTAPADSAESPSLEDATGGPLPEPATRGPLDLPARGGASPTPT